MKKKSEDISFPSRDLLDFAGNRQFATILADPPWQFINRTGKVAPEHRRLSRYGTMDLPSIKELPIRRSRPRPPTFTFGFRTLCFPKA